MERPFLTSTDDIKPLQCHKCKAIRAPTKFQPIKTHQNGVIGWKRRTKCALCPIDEPPTKPPKKRYSYQELVSRISSLEEQLKTHSENILRVTEMISRLDRGSTLS